MELASGKCQVANCRHNCQVSYEVTGCCLQVNGVCQDGHRFHWSSSEFHVNKNHTKIFDVNLLLASVIVVSGNIALIKSRCFLILCTWLSFPRQHSTTINVTSSVLQSIYFISSSKYVNYILYLAKYL